MPLGQHHLLRRVSCGEGGEDMCDGAPAPSPHPPAALSRSYWVFAVAFGGIQLFISQLPNLDSLWVGG